MAIHHTAHATPTTPTHFTIFLHYDYMVAPDHSDAPDPVGIQMVVEAFKKHNIDLIIDPHHTAIPEHKYIAFDLLVNAQCQGPDAVDFFALKKQYFHQTVAGRALCHLRLLQRRDEPEVLYLRWCGGPCFRHFVPIRHLRTAGNELRRFTRLRAGYRTR